MKGVSLGGSSLFPDSEIININGLDAVSVGGLGNFSAVDLEKVLAGKNAGDQACRCSAVSAVENGGRSRKPVQAFSMNEDALRRVLDLNAHTAEAGDGGETVGTL